MRVGEFLLGLREVVARWRDRLRAVHCCPHAAHECSHPGVYFRGLRSLDFLHEAAADNHCVGDACDACANVPNQRAGDSCTLLTGRASITTTSPAFTITSELLKLKSGMPGVAITYKSSNEMLLSVIGEQTLLAIADGPPTVPMVQGGKVRALAVTGAVRSSELPDVPSMAEAGYPDVDVYLWSGFFAPAGTPPAIVAKLEAALRQAIQDPDVSSKLKAMAVNPGGGSSEEFRKMIDADIQKFVAVVKAANLTFAD